MRLPRPIEIAAAAALGIGGVAPAAQVEIVVSHAEAPARERADALIAELERRTGGDWQRYQTRRYIVVSDAPAAWVRGRSSVLERSWHQYYRFVRRAGFEVLEPEQPLVAVIFAEHAEYEGYAQEVDGVSAPWVGGYYTTVGNKIVLFDDRTSPAYREARTKIDEARATLRDADRRADEARRKGDAAAAAAIERAANAYAEELAAGNRLVERRVESSSVARTVHEAVHQLSFNSGLQRADRAWPFWFSEGLATAFETEETRSGFGPNEGYGPRDENLAERVAAGGLMDWKALVSLPSAPEKTGEAQLAYAQAYGLARYLARHERHKLVAFVESINAEDPGRRGLGRVFEREIGDPDQIGRKVERWVERELGD